MEDEQSSYGTLIQNFNRWLLSIFSVESVVNGETFNIRSTRLSAIDQIVGLETKTTNTCTQCGHVSSRDTTTQVLDLAYPKKVSTFTELLQASIVRETSTKASCTNCRNFTYLHSKREIGMLEELPPVLCVNAMTSDGVWSNRRGEHFLPDRIAFSFDDGQMRINEDDGVVYNLKVRDLGVDSADIKSLVVQVDDGTPHLISFVKSMCSSQETSADEPVPEEWIMFNDFLVRPVSRDEVLTFSDWKVRFSWRDKLRQTPAIIIFEREDPIDLRVLPTQLDHQVLYADVSMAW